MIPLEKKEPDKKTKHVKHFKERKRIQPDPRWKGTLFSGRAFINGRGEGEGGNKKLRQQRSLRITNRTNENKRG